jgi:hypothetical protein
MADAFRILSDGESLTRDRRKESVATITDVIAPGLSETVRRS